MGMYVNPGNAGFAGILLGEYVDKTGLIALVNAVIGTPIKLVCSTRPRRFGKTFAAESLVAYYTCGADSRALFEGLDISRELRGAPQRPQRGATGHDRLPRGGRRGGRGGCAPDRGHAARAAQRAATH